MAPATGGAAAGGTFWRFSLRFYAQPRVAPALIRLQDEAQCDVNLILYALWFGLSGRGRLDGAALAAAECATRELRAEIVAPLRQLRRRLAPSPEADIRRLYEAAKRLELAAERAVQHRLAAAAGGAARRTGAGRRRADAEANLLFCLGTDAIARPEAKVLREAVTAYEEPPALKSRPRALRRGRPSA